MMLAFNSRIHPEHQVVLWRIERDVKFADHLAAEFLQFLLGELVGDARPDIVRANHEELVPEVFRHVLHMRPHLLVGSGPNMKIFLLHTPGKYSCSWPS